MKLRSDAWLSGDDEVALDARVALAMGGQAVPAKGGVPIIGVANSASDLNPCIQPLNDLISSIKASVAQAGGVAVEFPVMSLGEDLMKPAAMLYRNLVAMEVEESLRSQTLDGVIVPPARAHLATTWMTKRAMKLTASLNSCDGPRRCVRPRPAATGATFCLVASIIMRVIQRSLHRARIDANRLTRDSYCPLNSTMAK
jgi:hypothetical protein